MKIENQYGDETRRLTTGRTPGRTPGSNHDTNIVMSRDEYDGDRYTGGTVLVGMSLNVEQSRQLAYDLLKRIGDPVPEPPAKPFEPGEFVQNWQGQPTKPQVYRLVEPYVMHGNEQWWKVQYLVGGGEVKHAQIQTNRPGTEFRRVKVEVTKAFEAWEVVE
jgi:hypothetical protein